MLKNDNRTKFEYKTIFLFNYDDSASKEEIKRIEDENTVYKGGLFSLQIFGVVICPKVNICPKLYIPSTLNIVAHTIECVCSKINHGLNHGLFISLLKLIICPIH